ELKKLEKMLPVLFKMFVFDAPEKGFVLNASLFEKRYYPSFEKMLRIFRPNPLRFVLKMDVMKYLSPKF
ncbi:MAG: hypothetical protein ACP5KG_03380, partial [Myxococcota bacterium]